MHRTRALIRRSSAGRVAVALIAGLGVTAATVACKPPPTPGPRPTPPPDATCRPTTYEEAVIEAGSPSGGRPRWILSVNGMYSGGPVYLLPVTYVRQPEYWTVEVKSCSQPGVSYPGAFFPFTVGIDLTGVLGTKGVEVVGSGGSVKLDVPPPPTAPRSLLQGTSWQLNATNLDDTPIPAGVAITATFGATEVSGSAGCNSYHATYRTEGGRFFLGPIASTDMACSPDVGAAESAYLRTLATVTDYRSGGNFGRPTLTLSTGSTGRLSFTSAPEGVRP